MSFRCSGCGIMDVAPCDPKDCWVCHLKSDLATSEVSIERLKSVIKNIDEKAKIYGVNAQMLKAIDRALKLV